MRTREIVVPLQVMAEVARLIETHMIPAEVMGATDKDEIQINLQYEKQSSPLVFEIIEMIDEYNEENEGSEDDDEEDEDE